MTSEFCAARFGTHEMHMRAMHRAHMCLMMPPNTDLGEDRKLSKVSKVFLLKTNENGIL
jgi:hypothetical protein